MGAQLTYGTAGASGGGFSHQPGSLQPAYEERLHEPHWSYQQRGTKTWKDKNKWFSLWSFGCRVGGGLLEGYAPISNDMQSADLFEPYSCDGEGTQTTRFLKGICQDDNSAVVADAIVRAFRVDTNAFVGQATSRLDGSYDVPTDTAPGVAHRLVAYKDGSPDFTGASEDTITSTLIDGT